MHNLLWLLLYPSIGLLVYLYCVIKTASLIDVWDWNIYEEHIGVVVYPKWLLFWLYWIVKKVRD